jgi:hypothetical protein
VASDELEKQSRKGCGIREDNVPRAHNGNTSNEKYLKVKMTMIPGLET